MIKDKNYKFSFLQRESSRIFSVSAYAILILLSSPIVLAYAWLFLRSFSTDMNGFIPTSLTFNNWDFLWEPISGLPNIWLVTFNTFIMGGSVAGIVLLVSSMAGFALSKFAFKGQGKLLLILLLLHAFPTISLMVAIYYILEATHLLNSLFGVVLLSASMDIPWATWIIKGFYDGIPREVEWAGAVDGYSRISIWRKVLLPMVKPGLLVIAVFEFLSGWSQFIFITTFIFSNKWWTLSQYTYTALGGYIFANYGLLTAISVWYILPVIILFIFANKYMIQMSLGGIKR